MAKANPLQEQLLKAGLVKKSQVAQVAREQNKARHAKGAPAGPSEGQLEAERARAVWARKFGQPPADPREYARQYRFMAGRGFSADCIRRLLGR